MTATKALSISGCASHGIDPASACATRRRAPSCSPTRSPLEQRRIELRAGHSNGANRAAELINELAPRTAPVPPSFTTPAPM